MLSNPGFPQPFDGCVGVDTAQEFATCFCSDFLVAIFGIGLENVI
jgi:hypothetical protein